MKAQIALTALAILVLGLMPVSAAERACRPSLSNMYHCPDTSKPAPKTTTTTTSTPAPRTRTTTTSERPCRPSLSNLWTCPGTSQAQQKSARTTRPREEPSTESTGPAHFSLCGRHHASTDLGRLLINQSDADLDAPTLGH
jgi:hypothetical protein